VEQHPHAAIVKRACVALRKGNAADIEEIFASDSLLNVPGDNLIAGIYHGPDGLLEYVEKLRDLTDGTFRTYVHDIVANDHHVVAIEQMTARRLGRKLDIRDVTLFHVEGDGRVGTGIRFSADPSRENAFWS
jgi:ketosteroid isomerase-like protein